jgi:hypothetical protein
MTEVYEEITAALEPLKRLTKDLLAASATLSDDEARYIVDAYYILQRNRITAGNQVRTLDEGEEPHTVIDWLGAQNQMLENQLKRALDRWSSANPVGVWAKSIIGIGPVIAAGLLAHIDMNPWTCMVQSDDKKHCNEAMPHGGLCGRKPLETVGHIWRFAGLDPTCIWEKKEKRPYNAKLKTLVAFKLGESFVKVQNHDDDIYGTVFAHRKQQETERNERLEFKELAAKRVSTVDKKTEAYKAYKEGKLPPAHIHARARRYAVKLFLAHYHCVAYFVQFKVMPPFPYAFSHLEGHVHFIAPPNIDLIDGMEAAVKEYERRLRERSK